MYQDASLQERIGALEIRRCGVGRPLVLVHGIQGTSQSWEPILDGLEGMSCVIPNLPGRGGSPRCNDENASQIYNVDHFADLIAELIRAESVRTGLEVSVAGWSMGVTVVLRFLQKYGSASVHRIALLSGTPYPRQARWFAAETIPDIKEEARFRATSMCMTSVADPIAVAWSMNSARTLDHREFLRNIDRPTLVIHGDCDDQSPISHGLLMAQKIQGAQMVMLPSIGHAVLSDASYQVAKKLRRFFIG